MTRRRHIGIPSYGWEWLRWLALTVVLAGVPLHAAVVTWTGGGTSNNWSDAANWGGTAPAAGDDLVFAGTTAVVTNNDVVGATYSRITFSAGAGNFVLGGNALTLSGGTTALRSDATSGTMTIDLPLTFSTTAPTITTAAGGALVFSQAVANGGLAVSVVAGGPVTFSALLSGTGGVIKSGAGTLTFNGLSGTAGSNYTGNTLVDAGTIAYTGTVALSGQFLFGSTVGVTTVGTLNLSAGSLTLTGAVTARTNSASYNQITVGAGQSLTTAGGLTLGYSATVATNIISRLAVSGAGSFTVSGGSVQVGVSQATNNNVNFTNVCTLDVTALTGGFSTTAALTNFNVGQGNSSAGTVLLSNTANTIIATTLRVGDSNGNNGTGTSYLTLGTGTNVIRADAINVGFSKESGTIAFASQTSGSPGTVTIANKAGSGAGNVTLGRNNGTNTAAVFTGLLDLRGHFVTAAINALVLGQCDNTGTGSTTGTLRFDAGTMTVGSISSALKSGTGGGGTGTGNLEMSGGTLSITGTITTAGNTAATGTAVSNLTFSAGSVTLGGNVNKTGGTNTSSNVTVNGATFNANNRTIGSAAQTVVFNLHSGTLTNLAEFNGGGTLTKSTAGSVTLTGTNAWSGTTSIAAGALLLGNVNALPNGVGKGAVSVASVLDLNGYDTAINGLSGAGTVTSGVAGAVTLTCGSGDATATFTGVVQDGSGTMALSKTGTGVQTMSSAQTYTGATTISAGSLVVNNSLAAGSAVNVAGGTLGGTGTVGTVTMGAGGTLAPGNGGTATGVLSASSIAGAASAGYSFNLDGSATTAERVVTSGALTLAGTLSVGTISNGSPGQTYTVVNAGTLSGTFAGVADNAVVITGGRAFLVDYDYGLGTVTLTDQSSVWDGGGGDNLWSTDANWVGDVEPSAGATLVFGNSPRPTPVNDLTGPFSAVIFSVGVGNIDLQGATITLTGGAEAVRSLATSGTMTISAPLAFTTAAPTITNTAGATLVLSGNTIDTGGLVVTMANAGQATISGNLSGSGSLTKSGAATLTLSGNGTYSGGTLLTLGDLQISASGGAVSGPLGTGALTVNSGASIARVLLAGGQTVTNALIMQSALPGANLGVLQQSGTGLATWNGPLTVTIDATNGGHVFGGATVGDALVLSGTVNVGGSATRLVQRGGFVVFSGPAGVMPEIGITGTARLGAANTLPANVRVFASASGTTGQGGTLDLDGFNQTIGGLTFANAAGGIVTTGAGTLTLAGDLAQTFTGTLDANVNTISGNLDLGGATRTCTIADSSAANDVVISAVVANGAVTKAGTGTLAFTGTLANTYTGATTVSAGTVHLNRTAGINAVAGDLAITGGRVTFGANNQIADSATVTMSGTTSVFNGTGVNAGQLAGLNESVAALTITGGSFNGGAASTSTVLVVTGATSVSGGGNTIFILGSGNSFTTGSLTLNAMSATAGATVATNNSFTVYGNSTTTTSLLSIGSGGLSLSNSVLNLRRGAAGALGCRLVLDGDITTAGTANCGIIEDGNGGTVGNIGLEWSSTAPAVTRTITASSGAGVVTIGVPITNGASSAVSLVKAGASQVTLSGTLANSFTGSTTVAAGILRLVKSAGVNAIGGDLTITGGQVWFGAINQLPDTCAVTMSGTTSVFNGTAVNTNQFAMTETFASLSITGGCFNAASGSLWTITGAWSMAGGGNTIFVGNNGSRLTAGSLALTAMTATAGATVATNNSFTLYGTNTTQVTTLTVGAGGLSLDGSVLNLRRGTTGHQGSKLVLNGDVITTGITASAIREDTNGGTVGTYAVELGGIAGAVTRTITTAAGGADLTIAVPLVNGAATPASLVKTGTGTLATTATNTWSGSTTVAQGTLFLVGTQSTSAVTVDAGATLGGNGTIPGTLALSGTLAPGSGSTTRGQLSTGASTWNASAAFTVDLDGTGVSDRLTTSGNPIVVDGTLSVTSLINDTVGQEITILSGSAVSGTFSNAAEGAMLVVGAGGKAVSVSYRADAVVLTVLAPPSVTGISPGNGPASVQTAVVITGGNFAAGATVLIGGVPATGVVVVSDTVINAITPALAQGLADVVVVNPDTQAGTLVDGFAVTGTAPVITTISPAFGPALTATPVTITGDHFFADAGLAVQVGGVAATAVSYVNAQTLTATFPVMPTSGSDVTPDVVVTNGDRQQVTLSDGFTWQVRPIDDASGTLSGVAWRYHPSGGPLLPDFTALVPSLFGTRANPAFVDNNPFAAQPDNWSVEFGGYLTVPSDGIYTLFTASDDASRLYIGTTLVVNNNFAQSVTERSGQIALAAGRHRLRVEFADGGGWSTLYLRWQGPGLLKEDIPDSAFTHDPAPTIASISPPSGPQAGGTSVTIRGSDFVAGSLVTFAGVPATSVVVLDATTISATTPGGTLGAQDVLVLGPRSSGTLLAGGYTYLTAAAPTLTAITPANGSALGGTTVTLTVNNVGAAPAVTFNGVAATAITWVDATTVTCVTPAMTGSDATADVTVTIGGQSATLTDAFTWDLRVPENPTGTQAGLAYNYYRVGGPLIPLFSAQTPFSTGIRTTVTVATGTNPFEVRTTSWSVRYIGYLTVPADGVYTLSTRSDDGSRLYIGSTLVVDNNFAQDGSVTRSGVIALATGSHLLTVEYAQGSGGNLLFVNWQGPGLPNAIIPDSAFTTDPTPTVTSLDVITGPQSGGTPVTITGTGFTSGATVSIGGSTASGITVVNSTTITCTTPSHALGTVAVVVANPTGLSGSLSNAFTYTASAAPTITSITPANGSSEGGTPVTISGTGFAAPMSVTFAGLAATSIVVVDSTTITAVTPAMQGAVLAVDVVVSNGGGQSATLVGGFTYTLRTPENPTATQPGLTWRYHRVAGPTIPTFTGLTPYAIGVRSNATIAQGSPGAANPFDAATNLNWSVEFDGYLTVPTDGVYSFFTQADDHSQILFGSGLVLHNTTANVESPARSIGLLAGTHRMTIRMAQGTGTFSLNVRWQGPGIAKQAIPDAAFSTDATPTFTSITPTVGTVAGGTPVTIVGSGLTSGTTVTIGGTAATSVAVASDGLSLTAVTPAHAVGQVPVVVRNGFGLSVTQANAYLYQGSAPVISAVSPQVGPLAGGTTILIYGSNFTAGLGVTIGGVAATDVALSGGVISARTPAGTQGPAVVTVTNVDGTSASRSPGFYYQGPAPTIAVNGISPTSGPLAGGTVVTITGSNFAVGTTVTFDGIAPASMTVDSSTQITLTTAAGMQGPADVVVSNTDLRSVTRANGFIFEGPAPIITAISPTSGVVAGGTVVTITGSNFVAGAVVRFDGVAATGVTVNGPGDTITAITDVGSQGPADVTVSNIDLLADTVVDGFIFLGAPPTVSGVSPSTLPNNYLTTPITISGSGFVAGGVAATVTSVAAGAITVTMPAGVAPGPVPIVVTNIDLQAVTFNGFIAQGPAPILSGIDVPHGPIAGGRLMTLTGSAFRAGATVTMGGTPATVMSLTATTITAMTPAHAEGAVDVIVTNDDLLSSLPLTYTFYAQEDNRTVGNGCGTGGGLAVFLLLAFFSLGGAVGRRR
jgi:autotransporter-associated beta strand protein